jgi:aromatic ring-opening dioxygenase catalytic subunit (LigB family)
VSLLTACDSGRTSPRISQADTDDRSFRYHPSFIIILIRPATQYYGFSESFYDFTYRSRGDSDLSRLVVDTFESNDLSARLTPATESRGRDGRPQKSRPEGFVEAGLDHGVFIPFKRMFPDEGGKPFEIPIVEVSMSQDLTQDPQWELGAALKSLREQGILILAGGLTAHDFGDFSSFDQARAKPVSRRYP